MKVLVVGGANHYVSWINKDIEFLSSDINNVKNANLLIFTGGEDVSPKNYGFNKNSKTYCNERRDSEEKLFFDEAKKYSLPMLGVCRGAQLITALQSGGLLVQHCDGHARGLPHQVTFDDGEITLATSTHHQMMYPFNVRSHSIIAWSTNKLSDTYEFDDNTKISEMPQKKEPEIVFYSKTNCLAVQPHPSH